MRNVIQCKKQTSLTTKTQLIMQKNLIRNLPSTFHSIFKIHVKKKKQQALLYRHPIVRYKLHLHTHTSVCPRQDIKVPEHPHASSIPRQLYKNIHKINCH